MKKNVLLVMPKVPYAINDWNIPPIGLLYISASLKKHGFHVFNLNLMLEERPIEVAIRQVVQQYQIDIVATGDLVVNYKAVEDIIRIAKNISEDIVTIIGGGFVTHSPKEAMQIIKQADYGIIGEGEEIVCELISVLEEGRKVNEVNGIIYRAANELTMTKSHEEVKDLDELPWPDYEGFQYFEIARRFSTTEKITAGLTTSRSCPFSCTFCSTSGGRNYRQRSLDNIFAELEFLINRYEVDEIFLNDELFAVNEKRVYEFCKRIKKYHMKWHVMLRISKHIQADLLTEMSESGCVGICYGLESADNGVLKSMHKGITVEETLRVLKITKEVDLKVRGGFIFGDTKESMDTVKKTLTWIDEHITLLENVSISPIVLYPGSGLFKKAVEEGKIRDTVEFIKQGCPLVNISEYLSVEEYDELVHYYVPNFAARFRNKTAMQYQENLNEMIFIDKIDKQYIHQFSCEKCKKIISRILHQQMMFQSHFVCPHCGKKYDFFPNFLYFRLFEDKITQMLKMKNCAIWGCGETLQDLYTCNSFLQEKNIKIIDSNLIKQKHGFYGKKVYSPEKIEELGCEIIICCVGNVNYEDLKQNVKKKYKNIKKVIWLYDIGLEIEEKKIYEVDK